MENAKIFFYKVIKAIIDKFNKPVYFKIFFWFILFCFITNLFDIFYHINNAVSYIIGSVIDLAAAFSFYSFTYKKSYVSLFLWKVFFWINILYMLEYVLYEIFPSTPFINNLSLLVTDKHDPLWVLIITIIL